jgi:hypothetical protein
MGMCRAPEIMPFGDLEVLADIKDAGGGPPLFGFDNGDFSHGVSPSK